MSMVICGTNDSADNLIRNGSFVGHADDWMPQNAPLFGYTGAQTAQPGSGALACTAVAQHVCHYRPGGAWLVPLNGLTTLDLALSGKSASEWSVDLNVNFFDNALGLEDPMAGAIALSTTITSGAWEGDALRGQAVPVGATHVHILLLATPDVGTDPLYIDDVYVGAVGGDNAPYPPATRAAFPHNRLPNGDLETGIDGWVYVQGEETLSHETAAPLAGTGSIKVVTVADYGGQGVNTAAAFENRGVAVIAGETLQLSFLGKASSATAFVVIGEYEGLEAVELWTGTLGPSPATVSVDFVVPANASLMTPKIVTADEVVTVVTFWLDNVSLGTP